MPAYMTNLPWRAADGHELGGARRGEPGFARLLQYPNGGTGVVYDRPTNPDRGTGGSLRALKERQEKLGSHFERTREADMPTRIGRLTRLSGSITREYQTTVRGEPKLMKRVIVQVQCDCGLEYDMARGEWVSKTAPTQCRQCYELGRTRAQRAAAPRRPARIQSFTNRGHQQARDYTAEQKAKHA